MTETENVVDLLQQDLKNERMHCLFYQQAAALVQGLHRAELRELFLKEAQSELVHVDQFAELIVKLGSVPDTEVTPLPEMSGCPHELCRQAYEIETMVAENYARRLHSNPGAESQAIASFVHLFYEDQLMDSQQGALEFKLLAQTYSH